MRHRDEDIAVILLGNKCPLPSHLSEQAQPSTNGAMDHAQHTCSSQFFTCNNGVIHQSAPKLFQPSLFYDVEGTKCPSYLAYLEKEEYYQCPGSYVSEKDPHPAPAPVTQSLKLLLRHCVTVCFD
ncbi:hypothetical protein OESDEN_01525 [Oesophagostomum dentatum]|uniref:Chitin-binding type-2 domain-containing protein n=1 Tax=Oesophagostomum dentatum TaxID=61180 RepID=A0A0B1TMK0_OESDE|nr:hypothetical protein OESDEN_01525 [Oesophagostomum dentatum]